MQRKMLRFIIPLLSSKNVTTLLRVGFAKFAMFDFLIIFELEKPLYPLIMKNFISLFALIVSFNSFSQSGMYIVTEKLNGQVNNTPSYDSVFVTNPQGICTSYKITHLYVSPSGHDSQLNNILNGIISQGFQVLDGDWNYPHAVANGNIIGTPYLIRSIFLVKP